MKKREEGKRREGKERDERERLKEREIEGGRGRGRKRERRTVQREIHRGQYLGVDTPRSPVPEIFFGEGRPVS